MAIAAIGILLLLSALISGAEVAFFSIDTTDKEALRESRSKSSRAILHLLEKPKLLLATVLIANNFTNVAIVIISTYINIHLFYILPNTLFYFAIQVVAVTFLILFFGEVLPKVYATHHPLQLAGITAFPMVILEKVCWPVSALLISSTSFIHNKVKHKKHNISVDELSDVLNLTSDDGLGEDTMLKGIVRFGSTDVKQIMKSRLNVTAVDIKTDYKDLFKIILECGYSRIPIYKKHFDHIAGVLYTKDLLPDLELDPNQEATFPANPITGTVKPSSPWQNLIRPPFFVPENKKLDDLLKEFQEKKIHLAIVVDEYGGTSGIVTLEDVIEEIVGEISDEYDTEEPSYSKLDDLNYVFNGNTPLNDLYRILDIDGNAFENVKGESDTLAGFIIELKGRIPHKNEKINFANFSFTVEAVDKRRINRIKVTALEPDDSKKKAESA